MKVKRKLFSMLLYAALCVGLLHNTRALADNNDLSQPAAQIGNDTYPTLNEAFNAAAGINEFNGAAVSAENPVVIEILKDITLNQEIYVTGYWNMPKEWHVKLTSASGRQYTVTRDPEKVADYMIEMPQQFSSTLVLENIILDGGATENSPKTDSILVAYGNVTLNNGAILQNNKCKGQGGAIDLQRGLLVMNNGAVIQNNIASSSGGAVIVWADFIMNGGEIKGNSTLNNYTYGGGVDVQFTDGASFTMNGGKITGNRSAYKGGGIYFSNSNDKKNVFLNGGEIKGNYFDNNGYGKDTANDVYSQFSSVLVIGNDVEIGKLTFSKTTCVIEISSPLTNSMDLNYEQTPQNGSVIARKGANYGGGSLEPSKLILTGQNSRCLYLSEDGNTITINSHSGGTATCSQLAICTNCESQYGSLNKNNHKAETEWTQENDKHYHICEYGCGAHLNEAACSGGTATCTDKAVCEICDEEYGELDAANHVNLVKIEMKEPTHMTEGNTAYWYCDGCKKYFNNEEGTEKISLSDTVIDKLAEHNADETGWHSDENGHWNICECGEVINSDNHTFEWVTDKNATETETGLKHEECTVCGYKKATIEIPAKGTSESSEPSNMDNTTGSKTDNTTDSKTDNTTGPQTGDSNSLPLRISMLMTAFAALTGAMIYFRKKIYSK